MAISEALKKIMEENGYIYPREIDNVGVCAVLPFLFTYGLVVEIDEYGYGGRYCFSNLGEAIAALEQWDGKDHPQGNWIKYKGWKGEKSNENITHNE
jgi:hypothetical protein